MNISPEKLRSLNRQTQWAVLIATINPKNNIFPYLNVDGSNELKGPYGGSLFTKGQQKSRQSLGYLPGAAKMGGVPEHIDNLALGLKGASKGSDKVLAKIGDKLGVALSPRKLTKKDDYVPEDPEKSDEKKPEEKPNEKTMKGTGSVSENYPHIFNDLLSEAESDLLDPFLETDKLKAQAARIISMLAIMYAASGKTISVDDPEKLKPKTKKDLENFGFIFNQQNNIYIFGDGGKGGDEEGGDGENEDENEDGIEGCTDFDALNYNPSASVDDNSCNYPPSWMSKKAPGLNIDYGTAGSKITERIILRNLINNR